LTDDSCRCGFTLAQLGLDNIEYITPATSAGNVGIYFIRPGANMSDTVIDNVPYHYTYQDGLLNILRMPLLIVPKDTTLVFGEKVQILSSIIYMTIP